MLDWLTLSEIVEKTKIPYQTLSRYVSRHHHYLKLKKNHKYYLVHQDSLSILEDIRQLYQTGYTEDRVNKELSLKEKAVTIEVDNKTEVATLDVTLKAMNRKLEHLQEKMDKQEEFNRELIKQLEKQQLYLTNRLEERDQTLLLALKETMNNQKKIHSNSSKKWRFWRN